MEVYGIGAICLALIALLTKVMVSDAKKDEMMIQVIKDNAVSNTILAKSTEKNTKAVQKAEEATTKHTESVDRLSKLMLQVIKKK